MTIDDRLLTYGGYCSQQIEATDGDKQFFEAKQALYKDMLELLGEDERQPNPNVSEEYRARFYRVGGKNFVRQELRIKLRKYFGVEE